MNTPSNLKPQMLDPRRRLQLAACCALIDHTLGGARQSPPGRAAQKLALDLDASGIAHLTVDAERSTIAMHGVSASISGDITALLRLWWDAALDRLARP